MTETNVEKQAEPYADSGETAESGAAQAVDASSRAERGDLDQGTPVAAGGGGSEGRTPVAAGGGGSEGRTPVAAGGGGSEGRTPVAAGGGGSEGRTPVAAGGGGSEGRTPVAAGGGGSEGRTPVAAGGGGSEGRTPVAAGGGGSEGRTPVAAGGSYRPGDNPQAATIGQEGGEGQERAVVHPQDGVGYAFDSHATDVKVLAGRLTELPSNVQEALKQGGENVRVEITAGASRAGSPEYNQHLSDARGTDMADAMRQLGVKSDIEVNAVGESAAASAGHPDGTDDPADRVATFQVEVTFHAPAVAPAEPHPMVADKPDENVKVTAEQKSGVADPTETSKPTVKIPLRHDEFDKSVSASGKESVASGQAKVGAWGKFDRGFQASASGVGVYAKAEENIGEEAKGQLDLDEVIGLGGTAFVGERGAIGGQVIADSGGISASVKGEVFVGESIGGRVSVGGHDLKAEAAVEGMAGFGAAAEVKGTLGWDKTEAKITFGAALGLGAKGTIGFSFSPIGIAHDIREGSSKVFEPVRIYLPYAK